MKKIFIAFFVLLLGLISVSNSAPLDEIFQDVNVSGSMRYRFEHNSPKDRGNNNFNQRIQIQMH
ncbi:Campylo_MOMP domain-containing protein [Campylobacter lari]|uniref:mini-MOMP protein n=1 Tax=Campylobacter lari TaxID=201 RepID=UPI002152F119|nr:mini-MOMP protein [Campylobacter lari]MCR6512105.1 mini-MOMP protein [Campylobacter lari]